MLRCSAMLLRGLVPCRAVFVPLHRSPRRLHHLVKRGLHLGIGRDSQEGLLVSIVDSDAELGDGDLLQIELQVSCLRLQVHGVALRR
ncbi:MAG: hypothetical protein Q9Q13_14265 [Acidobacteriota bacterium]|nr:hypothetical protein [Acidobacteriota bacterium]